MIYILSSLSSSWRYKDSDAMAAMAANVELTNVINIVRVFLFFIFIHSWLMIYIICRLYLHLQVEGTRMAMAANIEHTNVINMVYFLFFIFFKLTNDLYYI